MEKVVVYVDQAIWLGHAETQQEYYVKAMLALQWKVISLTRTPQRTSLWSKNLVPSQKANLYVHLLTDQPKQGFERTFKWRWINNQVRQAEKQSGWKVNMVFMSWMSDLYLSPGKALLTRFIFKYPWVGLYHLPHHFRHDVKMRQLRKLRRILTDIILMRFGRCRGIGVFEEDLDFGLAQWKSAVPVVFFPEITEKRIIKTAEIDAIRRQADGRCIFGLLGHLRPRKGVMDFLRIASKFDSKKGFFLLAGKFDIKNFPEHEQKEIRRLLQTKGRDNCYFRLTHIDSPPEFNALVDCCDVLYLAYKNHYHSSGLLAKAALFNKPVIVSNGYCMGQRVTRYNLGLTVSSAYSQKLEAVNQLADKAFRNTIRESTGFATYNSQNSTRALNSALQLLLSQD